MNIEIIKSKRKSISIEVKPDLRVIVRAPIFMPMMAIEQFIAEKSDWINKNLAKAQAQNSVSEVKFTAAEIAELKQKAKQNIPQRAEYLSKLMGVRYNKVCIKCQSTRWGSCSSLKNLNFNCLLVLCPEEVMDYVIIHELCHLKEMNHSSKFWAEVKRYCPSYNEHKKFLKTEGSILLRRI